MEGEERKGENNLREERREERVGEGKREEERRDRNGTFKATREEVTANETLNG